jgi:hypothetical protein
MTRNVQYATGHMGVKEREAQYAKSSDVMLPSGSSHITQTVTKGLSNTVTVSAAF